MYIYAYVKKIKILQKPNLDFIAVNCDNMKIFPIAVIVD